MPLVRIKLQAYAADILDRSRTDAERINRSTKHDYDVIINEKVRTGRCQRGLNKDNEIDLISKSYGNWAIRNAYCVLYRNQKGGCNYQELPRLTMLPTPIISFINFMFNFVLLLLKSSH